MSNVRYTSDYNQVTHMIADSSSFLWIAYAQGSDGIIHIQKVYASALDQVIFDIEITANEIIDMKLSSSYVHLLYDSTTSTYIGRSFSKTAPTTTYYDYTRQSEEELEDPVSIAFTPSDNKVNILFPGNSSATNAKVTRRSVTGTLATTIAIRIDDIHIVQASGITVDSNGDLWIVTNTSPTKLVRMYFQSGGWKFAFTNLI